MAKSNRKKSGAKTGASRKSPGVQKETTVSTEENTTKPEEEAGAATEASQPEAPVEETNQTETEGSETEGSDEQESAGTEDAGSESEESSEESGDTESESDGGDQADPEPEPEKKPAAARKKPAPNAVPDQQVSFAMDSYEALMSAPVLSQDQLRTGATYMQTISRVAATCGDEKILKKILAWFDKHADGLMMENKGLRGVALLPVDQRGRVEVVYSVFRTVSVGRPLNVKPEIFEVQFKSIPKADPALILEVLGKAAKGRASKK